VFDCGRLTAQSGRHYKFFVTFVMVRGLTGLIPFWSARQAVKICAGMMYGMGVCSSGNRRGSWINLDPAKRASRLPAGDEG